jgi:hypothetical protein
MKSFHGALAGDMHERALESSIGKARGVLRRYGVLMLGTSISIIEATEDRQLFADMLDDSADIQLRGPGGVTSVAPSTPIAPQDRLDSQGFSLLPPFLCRVVSQG